MPKFAANLSMMYVELPFLDRFEAAAKDGFKAVEYLFPYAFEAKELAARLKNNGLQQVLFNLPPGGVDAASIDAAWNAGTRGIACIAGREAEFAAGADLALKYAEALNCPRLHMMAGLIPVGKSKADVRETYINNARTASQLVAKQGINLLLEPINTRDIPGFFLNRQDEAHALDCRDSPAQRQSPNGFVPLPNRRRRRRHENPPIPADWQCRPFPNRGCARAP